MVPNMPNINYFRFVGLICRIWDRWTAYWKKRINTNEPKQKSTAGE